MTGVATSLGSARRSLLAWLVACALLAAAPAVHAATAGDVHRAETCGACAVLSHAQNALSAPTGDLPSIAAVRSEPSPHEGPLLTDSRFADDSAPRAPPA